MQLLLNFLFFWDKITKRKISSDVRIEKYILERYFKRTIDDLGRSISDPNEKDHLPDIIYCIVQEIRIEVLRNYFKKKINPL